MKTRQDASAGSSRQKLHPIPSSALPLLFPPAQPQRAMKAPMNWQSRTSSALLARGLRYTSCAPSLAVGRTTGRDATAAATSANHSRVSPPRSTPFSPTKDTLGRGLTGPAGSGSSVGGERD